MQTHRATRLSEVRAVAPGTPSGLISRQPRAYSSSCVPPADS